MIASAVNPLYYPAPSKPCRWRPRADIWYGIEVWPKVEPSASQYRLLLKLDNV
jgi:hypothetical protein